MKTLSTWFRATKWSVLAAAAVLVLGLASMGLLGAALYFPVAPVLRQLGLPGQDQWHGDWVWPTVIGTGMAWSVGFLLAGAANHWLLLRRWSAASRGLIYLGVLWCWALTVWFVCLEFSPARPV